MVDAHCNASIKRSSQKRCTHRSIELKNKELNERGMGKYIKFIIVYS